MIFLVGIAHNALDFDEMVDTSNREGENFEVRDIVT
jgi:hypothetical protein